MHKLLAVQVLVACGAAASAHALECEALAGLQLADTQITGAAVVPAGPTDFGGDEPGQPPNIAATELPSYCRVSATVAPAINFEVWMPVEGWNGRFQGIGNHRFAGTIPQADMAMEMARGYAVAGTDTGHSGNGTDWMSDRGMLEDYGFRGIHEMTVRSKEIVNAYYGTPISYSYFNGCSTGGKQALTEVQRYPDDYDGVLAGDPNNSQSGNRAQYVWNAQVTFSRPETTIPAEKLPTLHAAVMEACDGLDGLTDGVLANPMQCEFDPATLVCAAGQDPAQCFSVEQAEAIQKIYDGPSNPRTGEPVYGGFAHGSELRWGSFVAGPELFPTATVFFGKIVFDDPDWDHRTFDFDTGMATVHESAASIVDAVETDLTPYLESGGKLLQYQGWIDVNHTPTQAVRYYDAVTERMGAEDTATFYRLFVEPGGTGCGATFDPLPPLVRWVEEGVAPDEIAAVSNGTGSTAGVDRPICAYPGVARWTGSDGGEGEFVCD
jgi:feruloyl esterase